MSLFAFFSPGPAEIAIICVIGVILFGTQLPKIARSLGQSIPAFKNGLKDINDEVKDIQQELKT